MVDIIWNTLIILCLILCFTHPTKLGFACGILFLSVAVVPELLDITGALSYTIYSMAATLGLIISTRLHPSRLTYAVQTLLLIEIIMNLAGAYMWKHHVAIHLSNYIFDYTGVSIATMISEVWLYEVVVLLFYAAALISLYDKDTRRNVIGNGFLQFTGDTILSYNIRFKDVAKCSTQEKDSYTK